MHFQPGNKYANKPKLWGDALRRAIAQDNGQRVREAAETLLDLAAIGTPWAVLELANRLDGKSIQEVEMSGGTTHEFVLATSEALKARIKGEISDVMFAEKVAVIQALEHEIEPE